MIFEGRAAFRTWCTGGAAISRVPVALGSYIVIVGFDYAPFIDQELPANSTEWQSQATRERSQHQVIIYSSKNKFQYNFRDWYSLSQDVLSGVPNLMTCPGESFSQKCFMVFDENVRVNIRPVGSIPDNWNVLQFGAMTDSSDELPGPMYGGTVGGVPLNSILEVTFQPNDTTYLPNNDQVPPTPPIADINPQFQSKVGTLINPFGIGKQSGMNYPMLKFQYVEVFEKLPQAMRGKY